MKSKVGVLTGLFCLYLVCASQVHAKKVYMVGGGDPATLINSVYILLLTDGILLYDFDNKEINVPGLGWEVTFVQGTEDNATDAAQNFDIVFVHESVTSADADQYVTKNVPLLVTEDILMAGRLDRAGGLWFSPEAGRTNNPAGDFEFEIIDNTHEITRRYSPNELIAITANTAALLTGPNTDAIAPGAKPLAKTGFVFPPERYSLVVADKGATGFRGDADAPVPAGADPAPNRRVYLGFSPNTQAFDGASMDLALVALTPEAGILFQRCMQWAAGLAVTADGTPAGVVSVDVSEWSLHK